MKYRDLRDFVRQLETVGELVRVTEPISPVLEMTGLCDKVLRAGGPALLFENPIGHSMPVLGNLFGTPQRIALGLGVEVKAKQTKKAAIHTLDAEVAQPVQQHTLRSLRDIGVVLSSLKEPEPPKGIKEVGRLFQLAKAVWDMAPKIVRAPVCQECVWEGEDVNLHHLPIQTCWPGDVGPLITWGLTITRGPQKPRQNLGIYRQQVLGPRHLILRWLPHRGGALDFLEFTKAHPGEPYPVAVALGADPATILGAVTPIPDTLSEYQFAGLLRGSKTELARCLTPGLENLQVPARAEIVLEGFIYPQGHSKSTYKPDDIDRLKTYAKNQERAESLTNIPARPTRGAAAHYEYALEGPYGDHTGYYNEAEWFPVMTIERITMRRDALYHSTYTGKPPDEPAILGVALNEVFVPLLQKQFPEIIDFYLPPEGCSYRLALVTIRKRYPGHAKRIMFGVWSFLRQFMYTKWIIVLDEDIDVRDWKSVIWALTTRLDPQRDTVLIDNTPIDYLDFASPISGLGSKIGFDATNKWPGETQREWGRPIAMTKSVTQRVEALYEHVKSCMAQ